MPRTEQTYCLWYDSKPGGEANKACVAWAEAGGQEWEIMLTSSSPCVWEKPSNRARVERLGLISNSGTLARTLCSRCGGLQRMGGGN